MWQLVVTLMQIYHEKEQTGQEGIQNTKFKETKSTRKFNVGALVCREKDKKWNKGHGILIARPHPANPAICEMKMPKELKGTLCSRVDH